MKLRITSAVWYEDEELIKRYPCLKDFGFELIDRTTVRKRKIKDEAGHIITQEEPYTKAIPHITIDSVEQLLELIQRVQNPIIIGDGLRDWESDSGYTIEIYDGYRE